MSNIRREDQGGEEVDKWMLLLKSYESTNANDVSGLLGGMANFLNALYYNKPVHDLSRQLWVLKSQLRDFPYEVNEHSKAIEALTSMFVLSMETMVKNEERKERTERRKTTRKKMDYKQTDFVPSQSSQSSQPQSQSHSHHNPAAYDPISQPQYSVESPVRPASSTQYQPYEETWEETTMDMDDFDLNQPLQNDLNQLLPSTMEGQWDDVIEMPLLEEEEGGQRNEKKKEDDERISRYQGGLRGRRTPVCISPSKGLKAEVIEHRFMPVSQRRIVINKQKPVKVAIVRRSVPTSPNKISLTRVNVTKQERYSIGPGKLNIARENSLLSKICPRSAGDQKIGLDNDGSSFISRSRARISGLMRGEMEESQRRIESKRDEISLEETVLESRKKVKEDLHDGRETRNPTEATYNTNLSETWWALEARMDGASLLSQRMKRLSDKRNESSGAGASTSQGNQ